MTIENHYPHIDELTDFQRSKIIELREDAKDILKLYPEYDTDFSLLRWLMGWDYNIEQILPKMRHAFEVLVSLGLDKVNVDHPSDVNKIITAQSNAAIYFPGGLMGTSKRGDVVYMQSLAKSHPRTLVKSGSVSELYRLCLFETELSFKLVRKNEAKTNAKCGVIIVMDLDGFSMDLLYTPTLKIYLNLLSMMQEIFPDFARKILVINCPMMMSTAFGMVAPVLSQQTREKVNFLDKNWKTDLAEEIGAENIYSHWGGCKTSSSPYGDLRMGGKIPEKFWYKAEDQPLESNKLKISVAARTKAEVREMGKAGHTFKWLWKVSSGDLDFSIEKNNKRVHPVFRCSTDHHPEIGSLYCEEDGEYAFIFDNSHGKFFGKDVKYKIVLEKL